MDEIELASLFDSLHDCRQVMRLCATSKGIREWCTQHVKVFAKHMSQHRAFKPFFDGVSSLPQYRDACGQTKRLIVLRNNMEVLLRVIDALRRRKGIKVVLIAFEYAPPSPPRNARARIELDMIDPNRECLLLKSSRFSNLLKLHPSTKETAYVSLAKSRAQNMTAASRILDSANRVHGIDVSRVPILQATDDLKKRISNLRKEECNYVSIRIDMHNGDVHSISVVSDVDMDDIRDMWSSG